MKKSIFLTVVMMFSIMLSAQNHQQGYVKTKGRMVNGKLVPGQGLKGATVSVHGRTTVLVNKDDGAFSFPVPEAQFRLDSVRKKGYRLVDMDVLGKIYKHSSNPFYLVMETPEQQLQDQLAAERKIRHTLTKQLNEREDEIEALKEQKKITDEEYRQALQKLYDETSQNDQLIEDMAKRYSELDYDQLDEFYRKVSCCIENGELVKADSLLRTKGNVTQQVKEQRSKGQAIQEQEEQLSQAKAVYSAEMEELAKRCYSYYETFAAQHMNDTAAYYLELRMSMDTTNFVWALELGRFFKKYLADYTKASSYFHLALRQAQIQYGKESVLVAYCYNDLGVLNKVLHNYDKALEYYERAFLIWKNNRNNLDMASCCINMGGLFLHLHEYKKSFEYYSQAMEVVDSNSESYAEILNGLGTLYDNQGDFVKAVNYKEMALQLCVSLFGENDPSTATYYANLGTTYHHIGEYDKAIEYNKKALQIRQQVFGTAHPDVADCYNNIAHALCIKNQFEQAVGYMLNAIAIYQEIYGKNNINTAFLYKELGSIYISSLDYASAQQYIEKALAIYLIYDVETEEIASCYNSIGLIKQKGGDSENALLYYLLALKIKTMIFGENSLQAADIYNNLLGVYDDLKNYEKSLEYAEKALEIRIQKLGESHDDVARSYNGIGTVYFRLKDYDKAWMSFAKAYEIWISLFGADHLEVANVSSNMAYLLLQIGEYERSIEYYEQSIKTYSSIIGGQCLQVGIFNSYIGDDYFALGRYREALPYYLKSIEIRKVMQGENHPRVVETQERISEIQTKLKEQENQPNE